MLGLKRGTVELFPHQIAWEQEAADTIAQLRCWMGPLLLDARHVGSTAIRSIAAKPIIDIAVGIDDFDALHRMVPALEEKGIIYRPVDDRPDHRLFVKGDFAQDTRTHHIHVVRYGGEEWQQYLLFCGYLNAHPQQAAEYEALKYRLCAQFAQDRKAYTAGKQEMIDEILRRAKRWANDQTIK